MRSIMAEDLAQLKVIDEKLAELAGLSAAEQGRKQCLIDALRRSRNELLPARRRARPVTKLAA
jgi:hypothetical protein